MVSVLETQFLNEGTVEYIGYPWGRGLVRNGDGLQRSLRVMNNGSTDDDDDPLEH